MNRQIIRETLADYKRFLIFRKLHLSSNSELQIPYASDLSPPSVISTNADYCTPESMSMTFEPATAALMNTVSVRMPRL